jgi:hypothetical protein
MGTTTKANTTAADRVAATAAGTVAATVAAVIATSRLSIGECN